MSKTAKNIILAVVAILLIAAIAGLGAYFYRGGIKGEQQQNPDESAAEAPNEVLVMDPATNDFVKLTAITLPVAMAGAEQTVQLTATVLPENLVNKSVDWAVAWQNPSSEWANGKNISDYASISSASDGSREATFNCFEAFGEPVVITVSSRLDSTKRATCTVNYVKRIEFATIQFMRATNLHVENWDNKSQVALDVRNSMFDDVVVTTKATDGTVDPTTTIKVELDDSAFYIKMREILRSAVDVAGAVSPEMSLWSRIKSCPNYSVTLSNVVGGESYRAEYVPMFGESIFDYTGSSMSNDWNFGYVNSKDNSTYYAQQFFYRYYFNESYRFFEGDNESASLKNALTKVLQNNMKALDTLQITLKITLNSTYQGKDYSPIVNTVSFDLNNKLNKYRLMDFLKLVAVEAVGDVTISDENLYI